MRATSTPQLKSISLPNPQVAIRAPSVSLAPYAAVFALRKLLSPWTNRVRSLRANLWTA